MIKLFMTAVFALGIAHAQTGAPAAPSLTDDQITQVLVTLDKGEIEQAKLAKSKSKNSDIKDFAKMMVKQHEQNEKDMKSLEKKTKIGMKDSALADNLKDSAKSTKKDLKEAKEFDKFYIARQVEEHQQALDALNGTLIPSAANPDLKAFLEKTRDTVATHLEHAKSLQSKLQ